MAARASLFACAIAGALLTRAAVAQKPVTIEVGSFFAPPESVPWLEREIAAFRTAHPEINVAEKNVDDPIRGRFQTHEQFFGRDPKEFLAANVTGIDSQFGYLAPYLAEKKLIKPIEKFDTSNDQFNLTDFDSDLLNRVRSGGKTWGVPWLAWDVVLVLDWELFQQAGIANPPRTWQEFIDDAAKLTKDANGDGEIDQWGVGYRTSDDAIPFMFVSLLMEQAGSIMHDGRFDISQKAVDETVQFMSKFGHSWNLANSDSRSLEDRLQDPKVRYAMHLETNYGLGEAVNRPGLRLVPMPTVSGNPMHFAARRLYFSIRKSSKAKERASWEFVKWMTRPDISLPDTLAGFPVRKDFTSRADYREFMQGKIQNADLIFNGHRQAIGEVDQVVDVAPALERYWETMVPAFGNPSQTATYAQQAQARANALLKDWYRN